eukprot:TRINITY_DN5904_c0_g1_i2.p1 TRINITY_DN5904_c0_g1~~TRINITY_DN5904_c0_g1_i2.p1  ORF type:complete len:647 (-),score=90.25 TRINITY_DN5904_c0_g1_i2:63-2003(-)
MLGLSKEDMEYKGVPRTIISALWNALHPVTEKITLVDEEGKVLKKKFRERGDSVLSLRPITNNEILKLANGDLVISRKRSLKALCDIIDTKSCVVYIIGSYVSGKTNILHQIREYYCNDRVVLKTDLIGLGKLSPYIECIQTFRETFDDLKWIPSRRETWDKPLIKVTIAKIIGFISDGLLKERFLWTIDEGHKLYEEDNDLWQVFCRLKTAIVHNSIEDSHYNILFTSVSPRVLRVGHSNESPFEKVPFCDFYFSQEEIEDLLLLLFGEGRMKIDVEIHVIESMADYILTSTSGHPGFTTMYFHTLYEYITSITMSISELSISIPENWEYIISANVIDGPYRLTYGLRELTSKGHLETILRPLLESGVLFSDIKVNYDPNEVWQDEFIRYGILRYYSDYRGENEQVGRSCISAMNLVNSFITLPKTLKFISTFKTEDSFNLKRLVTYLFENTPEYVVNVMQGWIQYENMLVPSEKTYQIQWYSLLKGMCDNLVFSGYSASFEMKIEGRSKVDLGILHGNDSIYQIELAANLPPTAKNDKTSPYPHSARAHYWRQVNQYHKKKKTKKSIVVVIYNFEPDEEFWWSPTDKNLDDNKDILYVTALHTEANTVKLFWGNNNTPEIINIEENSNTPLYATKPKKSKKSYN